jgi:hypothetical protein
MENRSKVFQFGKKIRKKNQRNPNQIIPYDGKAGIIDHKG